MKYLVNQSTKEHVVYNDDLMSPVGIWKVVETDAEGWIKHEYTKNPLPADQLCEVKLRSGVVVTDNVRASKNFQWHYVDCPGEVTHYRPILDKPEVDQVLDMCAEQAVAELETNDIIARLKSAHEAAQSIPDLLAELREQLAPIGLGVMYLSDFNAVEPEPEPDMSDWRNWREGDLVECVRAEDFTEFLTVGAIYEVDKKPRDGFHLPIKQDKQRKGFSWRMDRFRFHSRPEKTK